MICTQEGVLTPDNVSSWNLYNLRILTASMFATKFVGSSNTL